MFFFFVLCFIFCRVWAGMPKPDEKQKTGVWMFEWKTQQKPRQKSQILREHIQKHKEYYDVCRLSIRFHIFAILYLPYLFDRCLIYFWYIVIYLHYIKLYLSFAPQCMIQWSYDAGFVIRWSYDPMILWSCPCDPMVPRSYYINHRTLYYSKSLFFWAL